MKKLLLVLVTPFLAWACQDSEAVKDDFTGNETVYALEPGSEYNIDGTVTIKEKSDGKAFVVVALSGTDGSIQHPVHIHLGDISAPGADVYALLNPVSGNTGISETLLNQSVDESTITYEQLTRLDACLKVHLAASGPDRDIILAGGNIGTNAGKESSSGRTGFGVCKSE